MCEDTLEGFVPDPHLRKTQQKSHADAELKAGKANRFFFSFA